MAPEGMDPLVRDQVVEFVRTWLPESVKHAYRELIARDPYGWSRHPHFQRGVITRHVLRGNGFTEKVLGVTSLDPFWPDILARAVASEDTVGAGTDSSAGHHR